MFCCYVCGGLVDSVGFFCVGLVILSVCVLFICLRLAWMFCFVGVFNSVVCFFV